MGEMISSEEVVEFKECFERAVILLGKLKQTLTAISDALNYDRNQSYNIKIGKYSVDIEDLIVTIEDGKRYVMSFSLKPERLSDLDLYEAYRVIKYGDILVKALEEYVNAKVNNLKKLQSLLKEFKEAITPVVVEDRLSE